MSTTQTTDTAAKRLKHTHKRLTSALPIVTSALAMFGAVATLLDEEKETTKKEAKEAKEKDVKTETIASSYSYSPFDHFFALVHHLAAALALIVAVGFLVVGAFIAPPVSTTLVLTALVLLALWLAEVSSRRG